jgi:hypothetical protein
MRLLLSLSFFAITSIAATGPDGLLQNLPLRFERNQGQWDPEIQFRTPFSSYNLLLTSREAVLAMPGAPLRLSFPNANRQPRLEGLNEMASASRYFTGNQSKGWRTGVKHYGRVAYRNLYPDIDLVYYGRGKQLEYDFLVAPGADPRRIRVKFSGADKVYVDQEGALIIRTGELELRQPRPVVYQGAAMGDEPAIAASYRLLGNNEVAFRLGAYDRKRPLVIDPVLTLSTYFGGQGADVAKAVVVDSTGDIWVAGHTSSTNLPVTGQPFHDTFSGQRDLFLARFRPSQSGDASLISATYFGGSGDEEPNGIYLDNAGFIYLTGFTDSQNFPMAGGSFQPTAPGNRSIFVIKYSTRDSGTDALWYSSYAGGTGLDVGLGITTDSLGIIYVVGYTASTDFRVTPGGLQGVNRGGWDTVILQIDPNGSSADSLRYSSYFGAPSTDVATAVLAREPGVIYVAGYTMSGDFPIEGDSYQSFNRGGGDAFLVTLDLRRGGLDALVRGTFIGGSNLDICYAMAADSAGRIYLAGYTLSTDFPIAGDAFQNNNAGIADLFVSRLDLSRSGNEQLTYSTYLGGSNTEIGYGLAVHPSGEVFLTGYTLSDDFPVTAGAAQPRLGGGTDMFVVHLDTASAAASSLRYSTYLGGGGFEIGYGIAVNEARSIFAAGSSQADRFPVTTGAFRSEPGGNADAVLAVIDTTASNPSTNSLPGGEWSAGKITRRSATAQREALVIPVVAWGPAVAGRISLAGEKLVAAVMLEGSDWLLAASGTEAVELMIDPAGLAPGVHTAALFFQAEDGALRTVSVTVVAGAN